MAKANKNNEQSAGFLEFFQQMMATNQSYLKPWTDFMAQYQKMIDTSFRPHSDRPSKE